MITFDCDGVLVDSERLTVGIEAWLLTEMRAPHSELDVVHTFMGRSAAAAQSELERILGPDLAAEFARRSRAEIHAAFERELMPVPGIATVLARLADQGRQSCVASSGSHDKMRGTLGIIGLCDFFETRIFSATVVHRMEELAEALMEPGL